MSVVKSNTLQLGQSLTASQNFCWYQPSTPDGTVRLGNGNAGSVTDLVTVNSSGNVGIGTSSPLTKLQVSGTNATLTLSDTNASGGSYANLLYRNTDGLGTAYNIAAVLGLTTSNGGNGALAFYTAASNSSTEKMRLDSSGNLGLGVTPSGWGTTYYKALQVGGTAAIYHGNFGAGNQQTGITNNVYQTNSSDNYIQSTTAQRYRQLTGVGHLWEIAPSGTAGNAISFTQAMTLDASGWLNVGNTGISNHCFFGALNEGSRLFQIATSNYTGQSSFQAYAVTSESGPNAAATATRVSKNSSTSRSINAAGTLNASGADYAEYMTKAGDFEIAKGEVCGIDANGLLTNVFADAVSFVVKSTDPSYVGNDSWGANIDDKDVLEAERQKVDRIAFAGQVPVNVLGAKAGDYIIPIADGTGIKGTAVAAPTFEQYQIAVGKVIAIESDGRARIIVKVA